MGLKESKFRQLEETVGDLREYNMQGQQHLITSILLHKAELS